MQRKDMIVYDKRVMYRKSLGKGMVVERQRRADHLREATRESKIVYSFPEVGFRPLNRIGKVRCRKHIGNKKFQEDPGSVDRTYQAVRALASSSINHLSMMASRSTEVPDYRTVE